MTAAVRLLEFLLLDPVDRALATAAVEDEEISEEEEQAVARSKEWFQQQRGHSLRAGRHRPRLHHGTDSQPAVCPPTEFPACLSSGTEVPRRLKPAPH